MISVMDEIRIDFIPFDELRQRAERWLTQWHPSRDVPIPIELIIESGFEWNIAAVKGLNFAPICLATCSPRIIDDTRIK